MPDNSPAVKFAELAATIRARPCTWPVRLVAVDGGAGSGKSTFAKQLAEALLCPIVEIDDFLSIEDLETWWPRLEAQVLLPLFAGNDCRYHVRDWSDYTGDRLGGEKRLPWCPVLILEGVGASRQAVSERLHFSIWVDAPEELRLARGCERDAAIPGAQAIWDRWLILERAFHQRDGARNRANLIVDGTQPWTSDGRFWLLNDQPPET